MGLGRIRGGATPEDEEDADMSAEQETRSNCSFDPSAVNVFGNIEIVILEAQCFLAILISVCFLLSC